MDVSTTTLMALVLSIGLFGVAGSRATAQSKPPNVAERQQGMKVMAEAAKSINAMFKGNSPYDATMFKRAAEAIQSHSGTALTTLFDSSLGAAGSKASTSITPERQQFDRLAADLGLYAAALVAAADRNPHAIAPEMRMQAGDATAGGGPLAKKIDVVRDVSSMSAEHAFHLMLQTCTTCHAKFRVETK